MINFDNLPFNFRRDVIHLASIDSPSLLLEWRLINSQWKLLVESVLNMRSWHLQKKRLDFSRLAHINDYDENSRVLRGLETLIECETSYSTDPNEIFCNDTLLNVKEFLDKPRNELRRSICFLHGSPGNGTSFFLNSISKYYSNEYFVLFISGFLYNALPSYERLEHLIGELRGKSKSLFIVDDADKILLDYMRGVAELSNTLDWYSQKDKLLALIKSLQDPAIDCRIIFASNESSLFTEELETYIECIIQIPYKNQKQRLSLLQEFTKEVQLSSEVLLEDVVRRLNGHVIRAIKCVCQRAASIAILKGFDCIEPDCFDKAITYVVFRQNIRPFVIRPRPNMAALRNPLANK